MIWEVYRIRHRETRRAYIGVTCMGVDFRFASHIRSKSPLGKSIRDHGLEAFERDVIATMKTQLGARIREACEIRLHAREDGGVYNIQVGLSDERLHELHSRAKIMDLEIPLLTRALSCPSSNELPLDRIMELITATNTKRPKTMTLRESEILREMAAYGRETWLRPMDFGGRDSSDHAKVAARMVPKGLVDRRRVPTLGGRGHWQWRITEKGREALSLLVG